MTDQPTEPTPTDLPVGQVVMEPTAIQRFAINHPRAAKALAIIGVAGTALGAALLTSTVRSNKPHVDAAKDHILEAGNEAVAAVTPQSAETPA
jgi:hypothetical protein